MTIRIAVINHKGGVGKTTLVFHLALIFQEMGYSVLCVDMDPQCNLSAQMLGERRLDQFLDRSDRPNGQTMSTFLFQARPKTLPVRTAIKPKAAAPLLLPGDVNMYRFEEQLALAWTNFKEEPVESMELLTRFGRRLEGIEKRARIDLVLLDTAPSLGALNRNVVLESDFIVIPVSADLFSARGLKTIGRAIVDWMKQWATLTRFAPAKLLSRQGQPVLGGYVLQRIPARSTKQVRQGIDRIQAKIRSDLVPVLAKYDRRLVRGTENDFRLGAIPEIPSMNATQETCKPIWEIHPEARRHFETTAEKLLQRIKRMR